MANEITRTAYSIKYKKGTGTFTHAVPEMVVDVSGDEFDPGYMQNIGTGEEEITLGAIAAGGIWSFRNMDAAGGSTISIRPATGDANMMDILPGEEYTIRLAAAATPYAISSPAAANLLITRVDL